MKLYVLYTAYPFEGGYVHGVFSSREKVQQAKGSEEFEYGHDDTYIHEVTLDEFNFQEIEI